MSIVAAGGTISYANGKKIHTFTSDGTFTVTSGGDVEILVVAGGQSGGGAGTNSVGGGGGGGGLVYSAASTVTPGTATVTIGAGGVDTTYGTAHVNGGSSQVSGAGLSLTALGGGCGGGGYGVYQQIAGGIGTQGGNGGAGNWGGGGGGGGAGANGADAGSVFGVNAPGAGGDGLTYSISGLSLYYAGGGAGTPGWSYDTATGGQGGGGSGFKNVALDGADATYYGGGGAGGGNGRYGGSGYQGIVIISYDVDVADRRRAQNEDLANMPAATIKGRMTSSGIPQDLTASQVGSILVSGLTADTLADADEFSFWKAATSVMKKITWANIKATIQTYTDTLYVEKNASITGATKTKITYDAKGLVTAGADATTADIADSTNKRYVTDADLVDIGNLSGTNTGDQDLSGLQPLDADLTAIAGLAPANDDVIQRKAGAWVNRTIAQLTTDIRTVIDSVYVALTGNQTVAGIKTFTSAPTIAPTTPTDGTDLLKFTTERAWTVQQYATGGDAKLEFFSDTAGKYIRINPNSNTGGGLIVADTMPTGTLERLMVEGTGNIKGQVSTLSSTGYAFQRLKNDTGQTLDFGQNGSARTGTVFGLNNSTGGVGLSFIAPSTAPLAIGTLADVPTSIAGNGAVRISVQSLITNQVSVNYAADAQASDTYVITLAPALLAYSVGLEINFKANTANTGAATLNVNGLGAKTIVKAVSTALANNDILAGMFCKVIYDGTNFVLFNPRTL